MDSADSPPLLRPLPRRPFQNRGNSSNASSEAATSHPPTPRLPNSTEEDPKNGDISRTRSIINLTSSTLFGIYAPSSFQESSAPATPWGTGAETPIRNGSMDGFPSPRGGPRGSELEARLLGNQGLEKRAGSPSSGHAPKSLPWTLLLGAMRVSVLFGFGLAFGAIIAHLHDNRHLAPVQVEGLNRESWRYLAFWGICGVVLGNLLPWVDVVWGTAECEASSIKPRGLNGVEWNDVVRSVGAFVGIAFAIRKLPWSSPLQLSLTLALANPFLWYLLDRTTAGFTLSTLIGLLGTSITLAINPALIPAPTDTYTSSNQTEPLAFNLQQARTLPEVQDALGGLFSYERVGVVIWMASVFFWSCICFGSIGRLLVRERRR
ncbi:hypothetical protein EJ08DRAFT_679592 [Tothia fuscella]|uniref:Uncharacterized protein n=1 Tax=Tothia fuscella TaxID=1048955 RepID=A0A9P4TY24_9PEZI|nr:hypothetical protein EJ08DRAFT_679592 [Tothia fuscella]